MGQPAAKKGDQIIATDTHIVMIPSPGGPVPTPLPHPFAGQIDDNLSDNVFIEGQPAAFVGSTATNTPSHIPQGGSFSEPAERYRYHQDGQRHGQYQRQCSRAQRR